MTSLAPRSSIRTADDLVRRVEPDLNSGCWLWSHRIGRQGYGNAKFGRKTVGAHRVSWILHNGPIPPGICVCHRCDTPACVNPAHLFLGNQTDNLRDMFAKGRHFDNRGALNPRAKLTPADVAEIRALGKGVSQRELAARFGVGPSSIRDIQTGRRWRSLSVLPDPQQSKELR